MGSFFPLVLLLSLLTFSALPSTLSIWIEDRFTAPLEDRTTVISIQSARLLDLLLRDYTVKVYDQSNFKTGVLNNVHLPANLSGINVDTARFRCGSLKRYGAKMKEFHLSKGVTITPCVERVILIRQEFGLNWSTIYYENYNLSGYELVTPILGLLAYNGGDDVVNVSTPDPFELGILANEDSIRVNFTNVTRVRTSMINSSAGSNNMVLCVHFEGKGKLTLSKMVAPSICTAKKHGHFALAVEAARPRGPLSNERYTNKISRWKVALGCSVGAALGAFLLGLLLIAMFAKAKKRSKLEELVRRAYEEEALQVSMVGHVRAPTAPSTRTVPIIEREYRPYF